jgi:hypothetical protein
MYPVPHLGLSFLHIAHNEPGWDMKRLDKAVKRFWDQAENRVPSALELEFYKDRVGGFSAVMPIEHEECWEDILGKLNKDDILCDMGAAFGRMALEATKICKKVYMVELCPELVQVFLKAVGFGLPRNLVVICSDWRNFAVPGDVTLITCLVNINQEELPDEWWQNGRRVITHHNQ